jgi:hypothetical protein
MPESLITLAEQRLHARPSDAAEARDALEWLAGREGKTLDQLIEEMSLAAQHRGTSR